jgi:hypothetical protein
MHRSTRLVTITRTCRHADRADIVRDGCTTCVTTWLACKNAKVRVTNCYKSFMHAAMLNLLQIVTNARLQPSFASSRADLYLNLEEIENSPRVTSYVIAPWTPKSSMATKLDEVALSTRDTVHTVTNSNCKTQTAKTSPQPYEKHISCQPVTVCHADLTVSIPRSDTDHKLQRNFTILGSRELLVWPTAVGTDAYLEWGCGP